MCSAGLQLSMHAPRRHARCHRAESTCHACLKMLMEAEPPTSQPASGIFTHDLWLATRSVTGIRSEWNMRLTMTLATVDHRVSFVSLLSGLCCCTVSTSRSSSITACLHTACIPTAAAVARWKACSDGRLVAFALLQTAKSRHTADGERADLASWVSCCVVTGA